MPRTGRTQTGRAFTAFSCGARERGSAERTFPTVSLQDNTRLFSTADVSGLMRHWHY